MKLIILAGLANFIQADVSKADSEAALENDIFANNSDEYFFAEDSSEHPPLPESTADNSNDLYSAKGSFDELYGDVIAYSNKDDYLDSQMGTFSLDENLLPHEIKSAETEWFNAPETPQVLTLHQIRNQLVCADLDQLPDEQHYDTDNKELLPEQAIWKDYCQHLFLDNRKKACLAFPSCSNLNEFEKANLGKICCRSCWLFGKKIKEEGICRNESLKFQEGYGESFDFLIRNQLGNVATRKEIESWSEDGYDLLFHSEVDSDLKG